MGSEFDTYGKGQKVRMNHTSLPSDKVHMTERKVLHSWKDISNYMGYGVRTLQRYEGQRGLPVHRPAGKTRSAVLAFSDELDLWLSGTSTRGNDAQTATPRKLTKAPPRGLQAMTAKAKRSQEMARSVHQASLQQAKRVENLIEKLNQLRTARLKSA
jgi:hypothetical protein